MLDVIGPLAPAISRTPIPERRQPSTKEVPRVGDETPVEPLPHDDIAAVERLKDAFASLKGELGKVIVGQEEVIEELLIAIFARGHCLLVGVPGLAKTLMISTLADALDLTLQPHPVHARPDAVRHHRHRGDPGGQGDRARAQFQFLRGPVFANIVLADEINRTPPKTQAALLEAMQERQVTVGGERHRLPRPVLRAGHAEPDRAGRHLPAARGPARPLHVQHPRRLPRRGGGVRDRPADDRRRRKPTVDAGAVAATEILELQEIVRKVPVADHVIRYALQLARLTRARARRTCPTSSATTSSWGAGPRASQYLILGGQGPGRAARPLLRQRPRTSAPVAAAGAAAPHHHQLQRRGRGHQARRHRRAADQGRSPSTSNEAEPEWKTTKNI